MKKLFTFTIFALCMFVNFDLQSQLRTITLDFKDKKFTDDSYDLNTLQKGEYYKVVVKNINTGLHKVTINKRDSVLKDSPVHMPDFSSFSLDNLDKIVANIGATVTNAEEPQFRIKTRQTPSTSDIFKRIESEKKTIAAEKKALKKIQDDLDALNFKIQNYLNLNKSETKPTDATWNITPLEAANAFNTIRQSIAEFATNETEAQQAYEDFSSQKAVDIKTGNKTNEDTGIKAAFKAMSDAITAAQQSTTADKVSAILSSIVQVANNSDYTYTSIPQQYRGDFTKFTIFIEPLTTDQPNQKWSADYEFPVQNNSYVGVGLTFYGSGLHNAAYSSQAVTDTTYKIVDEKSAKYEIGMAALLRYGTLFSKTSLTGGHLTIGPGITISDKVVPRLLYGVGLSFGKRSKFTIDVGGISGAVQVKSAAFDLSKIYKAAPTNITVSQLKTSVFLSLGYLFTF